MNILLIGTLETDKASHCADDARKVGKLLAERGHTLMSGGGVGVSKFVVESYKEHGGKSYKAYFPTAEDIARTGEAKGPEADETINTYLDYPGRNAHMVKICDAVIGLCGNTGTLTETIYAVKDYSKKIAIINNGEFANWIEMIPDLKKAVFLTDDIEAAMDYLES